MTNLKVGGLFSGIGGWELGLERAGFEIAWHCDSDPFCRRILERHWPGVPCYSDVLTLTGGMVEPIDVLCGGFPCQDLSVAGKRAGIDGSRSGLWTEMLRLACEIRPRYVLVENVPNLLYGNGGDWMRRVLGDLAASGFDAEWDCLPASAFGAHHERDRVWIVAYPEGDGRGPWRAGRPIASGAREHQPNGALQDVAHAAGAGLERGQQPAPARTALGEPARGRRGRFGTWPPEPDVARVANGIPDWVDRMHALGNALVPAVAEFVGRRILEYEAGLA